MQVHVRDVFILAEVRYCLRTGSLFHAGVQIQDVFPACGYGQRGSASLAFSVGLSRHVETKKLPAPNPVCVW